MDTDNFDFSNCKVTQRQNASLYGVNDPQWIADTK